MFTLSASTRKRKVVFSPVQKEDIQSAKKRTKEKFHINKPTSILSPPKHSFPFCTAAYLKPRDAAFFMQNLKAQRELYS